MKKCNRSYESIVRDIISRELGSSHIVLTPVPTYPDSVVYEASTGDRSIFFKGFDPTGVDPDGIDLEAWAVETARQQGVPVPAIVGVDLSRTTFPGSYLLMEKVKGVRLDVAAQSTDVGRAVTELGGALRRLHDVKLSGFGWLDERAYQDAGEVRGSHVSWPVALTAEIPAALTYLSADVLDPSKAFALREQFDIVAARLPVVDEPVLLHGDFGQTHIYVDPDASRITGIVDFGERASGDWLWDFCEWETPETMMTLASGYGVPVAEFAQLQEVLDLYVFIKAIPWAAKWHRRGELQVIDWLLSALMRVSSPNSR